MLRELCAKDARYMYEWMNDSKILNGLSDKFKNMSLQKCMLFIENSTENTNDLHLAIADYNDEYMGTVSLKHIDTTYHIAEFAIVLRTKALGQGLGREAMESILAIGFKKYGLNVIYWQVLKENSHAIGFYDHLGYHRTAVLPDQIIRPYGGIHNESFLWYYAENTGNNFLV